MAVDEAGWLDRRMRRSCHRSSPFIYCFLPTPNRSTASRQGYVKKSARVPVKRQVRKSYRWRSLLFRLFRHNAVTQIADLFDSGFDDIARLEPPWGLAVFSSGRYAAGGARCKYISGV